MKNKIWFGLFLVAFAVYAAAEGMITTESGDLTLAPASGNVIVDGKLLAENTRSFFVSTQDLVDDSLNPPRRGILNSIPYIIFADEQGDTIHFSFYLPEDWKKGTNISLKGLVSATEDDYNREKYRLRVEYYDFAFNKRPSNEEASQVVYSEGSFWIPKQWAMYMGTINLESQSGWNHGDLIVVKITREKNDPQNRDLILYGGLKADYTAQR